MRENSDSGSLVTHIGIPMPTINMFQDEKEAQESIELLYQMLDELCDLSGELEFHLGELGIHTPKITLLPETEREEVRKCFKSRIFCEVLTISIQGPFSVEGKPPYFLKLIEPYFLKKISDLLVMANICHAGSLEVADSIVLRDGIKLEYSHIPKMDSLVLQQALELSRKIGWPQFRELNFLQIWQWGIKHNHFFEAFSNTSTGRALSAFSRLFELNTISEPMQLLWALMGIEAIYVKGERAIVEQVKEKSQSFLGPYSAYKKKITQMYQFRSRFVHGDLDFPDLNLIFDARDEVHKYVDELTESASLATAILVATLQEIIKRDWEGLSFSYEVHNLNPKIS